MAKNTITVTLKASIGEGNQVTVRLLDDKGGEGPFTSIASIVQASDGADAVIVEVNDFYYKDEKTIYRVYGAVLAADGETIRAHWEACGSGNGQRYTFAVDGSTNPSFIIGARPERAGVTEPTPFESVSKTGSTDTTSPVPADQPTKGS